ncbi:MAG: hypothetical protein KA791_00060 [Flavobacteriales bacterium]|nr:hypothetical protein [Flavobacteriales bacterium]
MSIRIGKILVTAAILVFGLQELLNMWRQTGDAMSVAVTGFINLVLAGLLLRSALKRPDPLVAPPRGWTIFWNVLGALCALSLIGNLFGLGRPPAKHRITVNGLTIPLDKCVEGSVRISKEPAERLAFCTCTATKLAELEGVSTVHERALESGRLDEVIEDLQREQKVDMKPFADCLANSAGSRWTLVMSERVRAECLARIAADSSYQDLVVSKFCDCLAEKVTRFSPSEVASWDPDTTGVAIQLRAECAELSRK